MPRIYKLFMTLWACLILFGMSACGDSAPKIVDAPAQLDLSSLQAGTMTSESLHGHWVFLDFWASWCPPCLDSFPWLDSMNQKYGDQMYFITINEDADAAPREKFVEQMGVQLPVIVDQQGRLMRLFEVHGLPTSLIISPSGVIVHRQEGFVVEKQEYYERIIRSALGLDAQQTAEDTTQDVKDDEHSQSGGY